MTSTQPHRIIQWATGAMGKSCLRAVIDRPDMELAGLYVYGADKVGKDAGDITRRDKTGVLATNRMEDILALDADVVIHAARLGADHAAHDDDIARLLASGKNVISINGNTFPPHWPQKRRDKLAAACAAGGVSFQGAGLNPGFAVEKLLSTATGICISVDSVSLEEVVLTDQIANPEYAFKLLGFGGEPDNDFVNSDECAPAMTLNGMFEDVVAAAAGSLGWALDDIRREHRMLPSSKELTVKAGTIPEGGACHIDWRWRGVVGGRDRIFLSIAWAMSGEYLSDAQKPLWALRIKGTPDVEIDFDVGRPEGLPGKTSAEQLAVAGAVMNAIPRLIKAAPGLLPAIAPTPFFQTW
ncbi:NAD(P)H-dependent amine dehydrogenase family protein [Hyphococcus luteus]|uniref:Dihydrodipicolinate reductase N-terminal domain-containing protein n=1 Tax=Hyphococcus luteus TaxID=2058213 RepID=A0A2S7K0I9_9PROT|nr:hypothetical protein [Marinicaulis flavus]PQA85986.1 hypothetical protein CW354_16515 [Marinicaulis flavus]